MAALVNYDLIFLEKSWKWLNDPEIKQLTLTPDFSKEAQLNFYYSLPKKKDYWIKGIAENNVPIGAMGLKHINTVDKSAEYWGYIGEKEYWGRGIGKFILKEALIKAKELVLKKIYLNVSDKNIIAKNLYLKMGFKKQSSGEIEQYEIAL